MYIRSQNGEVIVLVTSVHMESKYGDWKIIYGTDSIGLTMAVYKQWEPAIAAMDAMEKWLQSGMAQVVFRFPQDTAEVDEE